MFTSGTRCFTPLVHQGETRAEGRRPPQLRYLVHTLVDGTIVPL